MAAAFGFLPWRLGAPRLLSFAMSLSSSGTVRQCETNTSARELGGRRGRRRGSGTVDRSGATIGRMCADAADSPDRIVARGDRVHLRHLAAGDQETYLAMVAASRALHHPWTSPPADEQGFQALVARSRASDFVSLVGWRTTDGLL